MSESRGVPIETFTVEKLEARINKLPNGKPRIPPVKLADCELKQLYQYNCDVDKVGGKTIHCKPFLRLFRQCQGGLMVESTEWEFMRHESQEEDKST